MNTYTKVHSLISKLDIDKREIETVHLNGLNKMNPPAEYINFLKDFGWAGIHEDILRLDYEFVIPKVFFGYDELEFSDLLIFGSDTLGYTYAFAINNDWSVSEISPQGTVRNNISKNFIDFIYMKYQELVD